MTILYLENFTGKIEATGTITIKTEPISKSLEHSKSDIKQNFKNYDIASFHSCNLNKLPAVYVLTYSKNGTDNNPFYVGESSSLGTRFSKGDYLGSSQIKDPQGFKIKETIKVLEENGLNINVLYHYYPDLTGKFNTTRIQIENDLILELSKNNKLLNNELGFSYKKDWTLEEKESFTNKKRLEIRNFCKQYYGKDFKC